MHLYSELHRILEVIARHFAELSDQANPIHFAFPWRALTSRLGHAPAANACNLYDRQSLYTALYSNMLSSMTSQQQNAGSHLPSLAALNYLNSAAHLQNQMTSASPATSVAHSPPVPAPADSPATPPAGARAFLAPPGHAMTSQPGASSVGGLYGYHRFHPYFGVPKV